MRRTLLPILASTLMFGIAHAEDDDGTERKRGPKGPPEAALEACSAAVDGDPCSFEGRRGNTVDGTCSTRDDKPLACRPDRRKSKDLDDAA